MFSTFDIILIIILAALFIYGISKGLISFIIPIIAIIAALIIAPLIYNNMSKIFDHSVILKIISLIATYSIIRIILAKVEKSIKDILKIMYLSWVDRLLGAAAVMFISCIVIYFILSLCIYLLPEYSNIISQSKVVNCIFSLFKNNDYVFSFINNVNSNTKIL